MKSNNILYEKIGDLMPQYIDSYDNDSFYMMLEEVSELKKSHVSKV